MISWELLNQVAIVITLIQGLIWCVRGTYWIYKNHKLISENFSLTWGSLKPFLIFLLDILVVIFMSGFPWIILAFIFILLGNNSMQSLATLPNLFLSLYGIWVVPVALPVIFINKKEKALNVASILMVTSGFVQGVFLILPLSTMSVSEKIVLFLVILFGFPMWGNLMARIPWGIKQILVRSGHLQVFNFAGKRFDG